LGKGVIEGEQEKVKEEEEGERAIRRRRGGGEEDKEEEREKSTRFSCFLFCPRDESPNSPRTHQKRRLRNSGHQKTTSR